VFHQLPGFGGQHNLAGLGVALGKNHLAQWNAGEQHFPATIHTTEMDNRNVARSDTDPK